MRSIPAGASGEPSWAERPWVLPALIAAVALTIGMILGALLFGDRASTCPPCEAPTPKSSKPAPK
jgi:hypothetical protein